MLFQWSFSFYSFTVQHQCNKALPSFGIGVSGAKLTGWEISVFSCRQSIYLPSNVDCVRRMNGERRRKMDDGERVEFAIPVCSCSLWQMILSEGLHNSSWAIRLPWGIQSHEHRGGFRAYFNKHAINAKTSAQKWHVFHFHTWEIPRCYRFYSPHPDERDIALCEWACFDLITAVWSASCWIREVSEEKDAPQPVLGRVASLREKKTHNAILIGA